MYYFEFIFVWALKGSIILGGQGSKNIDLFGFHLFLLAFWGAGKTKY